MPKPVVRPPSGGSIIQPTEVFTGESLCSRLGISEQALSREVRRGHLRSSYRLNRLWFVGEWVMEWLRGGERKRKVSQ